jgi:hypothetical protein
MKQRECVKISLKEKADWVKGRTMILNTKLDARIDGILSSS